MTESDPEQREAEAAAAEAAAIGGDPGPQTDLDGEPVDEARRAVVEAGEGEAEGFEQAEQELVEHATHGDQHAARHVLADASAVAEDPRGTEAGEADAERSSEREEDR